MTVEQRKSDGGGDRQLAESGRAAAPGSLQSVESKPGKAHEHASRRDWPRYYDAVAGKPARDTLLKALALFDAELAAGVGSSEPRRAIDVGCGSGRDTYELLGSGWRVTAMDSSPRAFELLEAQVPSGVRTRLECRLAEYERFDVPAASLVNASYALPFCDPVSFPDVWARIVRALPVGGRFAGQFFGERDAWSVLPDRTHHTRSQVEHLFADFIIEELREEEKNEAGVTGEVKDWHLFHVVARKRR